MPKYFIFLGFPGGSVVKNPPANAGDADWSLGQEDPLEKEIATHSNSLAWDIPWTEEPGVLQSTGLQQSRTQLFMLSCETTFYTFMLLQMVIFKHFNF